MPPTNDVVFVEGPLRRDNRLLQGLAKIAQVREFPAPTGPALERWISQRVEQAGAVITQAAIRLLADVIGPDLWTQSNEIEKLALYRYRQEIQPEDVGTMVSPAREASVFAAVDAVLERRSQTALQLIARLLETTGTVPYVISMLARQVRLVLLAQELLQQRLPQTEMGTRLGLTSSFPLRKTLDQARKSTPQSMRLLHQMLLESDIAIKTGELEERLALEVLVARFCHSGAAENRRARAG
jgi:DNA polymerase-3 subunit delta